MHGAFSRISQPVALALIGTLILTVCCGSAWGARARPLDPLKVLEQLPPPDVRYPTAGARRPGEDGQAKPPVSPELRRPMPEGPLPFPLSGRITGSLSMPLQGSPASSGAQVRIPASGGATLAPAAGVAGDTSSRTGTGTPALAVRRPQPAPPAPKPSAPLSTATAAIPKPKPAPAATAPASLARLPATPTAPISHTAATSTSGVTATATAAAPATTPQVVAGVPAASESVASAVAPASGAALDPELAVAGSETGEEEPTAENASAEAVLAQARSLHDSGSIDEMIALLDEQSDLVGDHPEAARLRLEQLLKAAKPDYMGLKRQGDIILQSEPQDPEANYAVGLYWVYSKKADAGKALTHLGIARSAKRPPSGAGSLYWTVLAKRFWPLALLPLAGLAFIVDRLRKRRSGMAAGAESPPGPAPAESMPPRTGLAGILGKIRSLFKRPSTGTQGAEPVETATADASPAGGWKARLEGILGMIKSLASKLKKRPSEPEQRSASDAPPASAGEQASAEPDDTASEAPGEEETAGSGEEAAPSDEEITEEDFAEPEESTSEDEAGDAAAEETAGEEVSESEDAGEEAAAEDATSEDDAEMAEEAEEIAEEAAGEAAAEDGEAAGEIGEEEGQEEVGEETAAEEGAVDSEETPETTDGEEERQGQ